MAASRPRWRGNFGSRNAKDKTMVASFDNVQLLGKDQFEAASSTASAIAKGWQGIAAETQDYSKKSFAKGRAFAEKILGVKKFDEALALQQEYAKSSYEDFVAQATKMGELYTDLAKEVFKPIETAAKTFNPGVKTFGSAE
jgi:hypothetical protein